MMTTDAPCHSHTPAPMAPLADFPGLGPCGQPCEHPCEQPCDEKSSVAQSLWAKWLKSSLFNTLDVCFDDVYQEPKKILIVGGCRQMDWSQHIALLLPAAEITLVDPDAEVVKRAQEEICCRFKFITAPLEQLPFERDTFDLTLAHNFMAYPAQWQTAIGELARVTQGNLWMSVHRPLLWRFAKRFHAICRAMTELGLVLPTQMPSSFDFLSQLTRYAKIKTKLAPFPWMVYMTQVKPKWDEKLEIAS